MRTIDIYVDGHKADTWTSSGTTTAFENVKLGFHYTSSTSSYSCDHPGVAVENTIELRGVLADSEWLSIVEVGWVDLTGFSTRGSIIEWLVVIFHLSHGTYTYKRMALQFQASFDPPKSLWTSWLVFPRAKVSPLAW